MVYGPVFESMFTGSMYGAGAVPFAVLTYAIAACDREGKLEINPDLLARMIGCDPKEVAAALVFLESEDQRSRSDELEGVRLAHEGKFRYHLVNYRFYQKLASAKNKQERDRLRQQQNRDAAKAETVHENDIVASRRPASPGVAHVRPKTQDLRPKTTSSSPPSPPSPEPDDVERKQKPFRPPTPDQVQSYLDEKGERRFTGEEFVDHYDGQGWIKANGQPIVAWKGVVNGWIRKRDREAGAAEPAPESFHPEDLEYQTEPEWAEYVEHVLSLPPGEAERFTQWKSKEVGT